MHTVTTAALERISGDFSFTVQRDGLVHGFGSWFDVGFQGSTQARGNVFIASGDAPRAHAPCCQQAPGRR